MKFSDYPHFHDGHTYARNIVKEKIPACEFTKLACERYLRDTSTKNFQYVLDPAKAEKVCNYLEMLPHVKGEWARRKETLKLQPWQKFANMNIYGWVDKDTGNRRFKEAYIKVPRKNGKTFWICGLGLYGLTEDAEEGAEVYCGATSEDQARLVFNPAAQIVKKTQDLQDEYGVQALANSIVREDQGAFFKPLIGNPGDGGNPYLALIDEFHEHKTDNLLDTMQTGMGSREQPLTIIITTAGSDIASPCYQKELEIQDIVSGKIKNEEMFGILYGIDKDDDFTTELAARKANPNYGISVKPRYIQTQVMLAKTSPRKQNTILTKNFNVWVHAKAAWMNKVEWDECAGEFDINDFKDAECVLGIDLSSNTDITAKVRIFIKNIDGLKHYYAVAPEFWLPSERIESLSNSSEKARSQMYAAWAESGLLHLCDGAEVRYSEIQDSVMTDIDNFNVQETVYDPWRAAQLAQNIEDEGGDVVEYRNTAQNMSAPMKEIEGAVKAKRFHHDGNPILSWMFSNVVAKEYADSLIKPSKEKPDRKIDGAVASIMAVGRAMHIEIDSVNSIYEKTAI